MLRYHFIGTDHKVFDDHFCCSPFRLFYLNWETVFINDHLGFWEIKIKCAPHFSFFPQDICQLFHNAKVFQQIIVSFL